MVPSSFGDHGQLAEQIGQRDEAVLGAAAVVVATGDLRRVLLGGGFVDLALGVRAGQVAIGELLEQLGADDARPRLPCRWS